MSLRLCPLLEINSTVTRAILRRAEAYNTGEGIFWIVASVLTTLLNLLAILIIIKSKSYKSPYFVIMLALLMGDALAGLVVFPLRAAARLLSSNYCEINTLSRVLTRCIFLTSAIYIGMLACDRYLRVNLDFRYREKVTLKRTMSAILAFAIFGVTFSLASIVWDLRLVLGFIIIQIIIAVIYFYYQLTQRLKVLRASSTTNVFISTVQQLKVRRSIRIIAVLLAVTLIIWLPGMFATTTSSVKQKRGWGRRSYVLKLLPRLKILSSLTDPIFYFWMNEQAWRYLRSLLPERKNTVGVTTMSCR